MQKVPVVDPEKCIGCRICELVCSSRDGGGYNPKKSFVKVLSNNEMSVRIPVFSINCISCGRCVKFCPTNAIQLVDPGQAAIIRKNSKIPSIPAPLVPLRW